ncbi:radial spoke head 10 homolog B-like [Prorops nasuta]|uniref:radial spoke head 10 homolog B-like n=1 Tax=Prorops nasuta TaxID=863751 RepID=UPI0034CD7081
MMEGDGTYKWENGSRYKGEFQENQIHGKGFLEWKDQSYYEGEFFKGFRHGRGTMVIRDYKILYIGQWHMGHKHGKGYCRYPNEDSYDGEWLMGQRHGFGARIYKSGARYVGHWENGLRHGIGTMAWPNGDVYRGEWDSGRLNGYGEYIWNGFFNKTLCWPRQASYIGNWKHGMRHGKGALNFSSLGGAKYVGNWKCDKKHGYGMIIGNNGEVIESDNLFHNDNLRKFCHIEELSLKEENIVECSKEFSDTVLSPSTESASSIERSEITAELTMAKPEQFPLLWYNIYRLLNPELIKKPLVTSSPSGKCNFCDENASCNCLLLNSNGDTGAEVKMDNPENKFDMDERLSYSSFKLQLMNEQFIAQQEFEEKELKNCIMTHMSRLREIYDVYARIFSEHCKSYNLVLSKLALWQLWRDCGINKKLSLAEIDDSLAQHQLASIKKTHNPFDKIQIWQFLYALLEVSWHLYTKVDKSGVENVRGKLAGGLQKFLEDHIFPNAGNHIGTLCKSYDVLPLYSVYQLYCKTGKPLIAKNFLKRLCSKEGGQLSKIFHQPSFIVTSERFANGINCVTVGDRLTYIPKENNFLPQSPKIEAFESPLATDLFAFQELGATKLIEIIANICPLIKCNETDLIINMDYELTFLEFYEILLEAAKQLLVIKKNTERKLEKATSIVEEIVLQKND